MNFEEIFENFSNMKYRDANWSHHELSEIVTVSTLKLDGGWVIVNAHDEESDERYLLHAITVISPTGEVRSGKLMEDKYGDEHLSWEYAKLYNNEDLGE